MARNAQNPFEALASRFDSGLGLFVSRRFCCLFHFQRLIFSLVFQSAVSKVARAMTERGRGPAKDETSLALQFGALFKLIMTPSLTMSSVIIRLLLSEHSGGPCAPGTGI